MEHTNKNEVEFIKNVCNPCELDHENNFNNNDITLDFDVISNATTLLKDTDNNNDSALHSVSTNNVTQSKKKIVQPNLMMLLHPDKIHSIINPKSGKVTTLKPAIVSRQHEIFQANIFQVFGCQSACYVYFCCIL